MPSAGIFSRHGGFWALGAAGVLCAGLSVAVAGAARGAQSASGSEQKDRTSTPKTAAAVMSSTQQKQLVRRYCVTCHTESEKPGGLSLETFAGADQTPGNIVAMMVRKLKAGQMPPPGMPRPADAELKAFVAALEAVAIPGMETAGQPALAPAQAPKIVEFPHTGDVMTVAAQNAMVHQICTQCHTDQRKPGGLSFEQFDMATAPSHAAIAEDMIAKLRAGMMPKASAPMRPDGASIHAFVMSLEKRLDQRASSGNEAGRRVSQRLNRAEYSRSIEAMLGLDINVGQWLPPDTMSHSFDNIANVQMSSPTLVQGFLDAADAISRLAVGDPTAQPTSVAYDVDPFVSQMDHTEDAPIGTRGGVSVLHIFPADGTYRFKLVLFDTPVGDLYGLTTLGEQIEVSVNDRRVALLDIDPRMSELDAKGMTLETSPIHVQAGPQRVTAAFIRRSDGPIDDLISPHDFTLADPNIGSAQGVTTLPHLRTLSIAGPFQTTGVSSTISRERIFLCRPVTATDETPCATKIVEHLAEQAYRRMPTPSDMEPLMAFYRRGREESNFEGGIRLALQAILASPDFLFRFEAQPATARAGQEYRISDADLASRLSYFIWSLPPDAELMKLADVHRLHEPAVLDRQVRRMLKDPRSFALSSRFAAMWLRLQDVDKMHPDPLLYPQYDRRLGDAMKRETELFFDSIVRGDRNVLDLLTADYTFANESLAAFYGLPHVAGPDFQRVSLRGTERRGLLGQGSILVETSVADRTSPVQRGKWVLEVLLGQPPPPPPPNVDTNLDDSAKAVQGGKTLSTRERMEQHRANPFCASCHSVIDPIGLALENFDPTGHWRIKDNGVPVDTAGTLYDGTTLSGLQGLEAALIKHQDTFLRVFTKNLMAYALGRQVEYADMPTVRAIVSRAAANGDRFSAFVLGIVNSDAFLKSQASAGTTTSTQAAAASQKPF
jgi:mono/diheme cytochrome c family protein